MYIFMNYKYIRICKYFVLLHLTRVQKQNFNQVDCAVSRLDLIFRI